MSKAKLALTLGTLSMLGIGWAAPLSGAAHSNVYQQSQTPAYSKAGLSPIRFREDKSAGLLVSGWINGAGPFTFAIDTGAGVSIISNNVVALAGLRVTRAKRRLVGGLSTSRITSSDEAQTDNLALGTNFNYIPGRPTLAVVPTLPASIDGILDPTDLFAQFAYSIDLPNHQLLVFDSKKNAINTSRPPKDGAIVPWVREAGSQRPFVRLGDGRLALLDTGSSLGLGINGSAGETGRNHIKNNVTDLGGGVVQSKEISPATVSIGALELRGVPTTLLIGTPPGTPLILGRRALFPFKVTFEPTNRLIIFEPTLRSRER